MTVFIINNLSMLFLYFLLKCVCPLIKISKCAFMIHVMIHIAGFTF